MTNFTITLTSAQEKALDTVAVDITDWITNSATARADTAISYISSILMAHCNANSIAIAVGVEAQIDQALELGIISNAEAPSGSPAVPE